MFEGGFCLYESCMMRVYALVSRTEGKGFDFGFGFGNGRDGRKRNCDGSLSFRELAFGA